MYKNFLLNLNFHQKKLAANWLFLAVFALALSGLFALAPAFLRSSYFKDFLDVQHIFDIALIIHVNLSIIIWFSAVTCMLISLTLNRQYIYYAKIIYYISFFATLLIAFSVFYPDSIAVKNNYIPMIVNPIFIIGLSLTAFSFLFYNILFFINLYRLKFNNFNLQIATICLIGINAFIAFYFAASMLEETPDFNLDYFYFYENLYWGGGHILQFLYVNIMMLAWFFLAYFISIPQKFNLLFIINCLLTLPCLMFYIIFDDLSIINYYFTLHMRYFSFIAIIPAFYLIFKLISTKGEALFKTSLLFSILFFLYGGGLALFIDGSSTLIPAHYHASVVGGVTIALIGLAYLMTETLDLYSLPKKAALIQIYIYTVGQFMHVTGLALMGGYGALRKEAASSENIDTFTGKILFFTGGLGAIIGGLLFVIIMFKIFYKTKIGAKK